MLDRGSFTARHGHADETAHHGDRGEDAGQSQLTSGVGFSFHCFDSSWNKVWKPGLKRRRKKAIPANRRYRLAIIKDNRALFPYVGIIQIRLWVGTNQFPLSRLQPAPRFMALL